MALDGHLHLLVAEHHRAEHGLLGQSLGLGFDHQHRRLGAGNHQVELRAGLIGARRVEQVLAVAITDARGADRAVERHAGNHQAAGGAQQRRNIGIDVGIQRQHRGDDLYFVGEAIRKQRTDRPVDQARGQRLAFGRPALALEEAARDAAGGIGLLDVVDGQREKIAARHRGFAGTRR